MLFWSFNIPIALSHFWLGSAPYFWLFEIGWTWLDSLRKSFWTGWIALKSEQFRFDSTGTYFQCDSIRFAIESVNFRASSDRLFDWELLNRLGDEKGWFRDGSIRLGWTSTMVSQSSVLSLNMFGSYNLIRLSLLGSDHYQIWAGSERLGFHSWLDSSLFYGITCPKTQFRLESTRLRGLTTRFGSAFRNDHPPCLPHTYYELQRSHNVDLTRMCSTL